MNRRNLLLGSTALLALLLALSALAPAFGARFPHAWLSAVAAWSGWPLGSMALLLAHALTGGAWGDALRPALRLGVATLPVLLVLLAPLLFVLPGLYSWLRPGAALPNAWYLNPSFFAARWAAYALVWLAIAVLVLRGRGLNRIAPPALILLAVTTTFAAIDGTMSLEPRFVSSIYGMLAAAGAAVVAMAAAVLLTLAAPDTGLSDRVRSDRLRSDLGKLLLAFAILWTYLDFMQLLIVWQSDLVEQAPWYGKRTSGGWGLVAWLVVIGHSVLPIALLLSRRMRRSRRVLTAAALLLLGAEALRSWWLVLPAAPRGLGLLDVGFMLGLGGLAAGLALRPNAGKEPRDA